MRLRSIFCGSNIDSTRGPNNCDLARYTSVFDGVHQQVYQEFVGNGVKGGALHIALSYKAALAFVEMPIL